MDQKKGITQAAQKIKNSLSDINKNIFVTKCDTMCGSQQRETSDYKS
jgi:hypothetical protein